MLVWFGIGFRGSEFTRDVRLSREMRVLHGCVYERLVNRFTMI